MDVSNVNCKTPLLFSALSLSNKKPHFYHSQDDFYILLFCLLELIKPSCEKIGSKLPKNGHSLAESL